MLDLALRNAVDFLKKGVLECFYAVVDLLVVSDGIVVDPLRNNLLGILLEPQTLIPKAWYSIYMVQNDVLLEFEEL